MLLLFKRATYFQRAPLFDQPSPMASPEYNVGQTGGRANARMSQRKNHQTHSRGITSGQPSQSAAPPPRLGAEGQFFGGAIGRSLDLRGGPELRLQ